MERESLAFLPPWKSNPTWADAVTPTTMELFSWYDVELYPFLEICCNACGVLWPGDVVATGAGSRGHSRFTFLNRDVQEDIVCMYLKCLGEFLVFGYKWSFNIAYPGNDDGLFAWCAFELYPFLVFLCKTCSILYAYTSSYCVHISNREVWEGHVWIQASTGLFSEWRILGPFFDLKKSLYLNANVTILESLWSFQIWLILISLHLLGCNPGCWV